MNIIFEIDRGKYSLTVTTKSRLADEQDKRIEVPAIGLYDLMRELATKYNNHPDGCIGVGFTIG